MNEEEKRELARYLLPSIMWDLRRAESFEFNVPKDSESPLRNQVKVNELESIIRHKLYQIYNDGAFTVVIIPTIKEQKRLI